METFRFMKLNLNNEIILLTNAAKVLMYSDQRENGLDGYLFYTKRCITDI